MSSATHTRLFHFGDPAAPLYGSLVPATDSARDEVVVLCNPFGQEALRAHRAFRQMATLVARSGLPVVRFDYRGTGDSAGESDSIRLDQWIDDARTAIEEARRRTGASRVSLVGLRLGAYVAARASAGRSDVARLILWDPVTDGPSLVREMGELRTDRDAPEWWINGFPLPDDFREGLLELDPASVEIPESTRVLQVVSQDDGAREPGGPLTGWGTEVENHRVPPAVDWNGDDDVGGQILPHEAVRLIVEQLRG